MNDSDNINEPAQDWSAPAEPTAPQFAPMPPATGQQDAVDAAPVPTYDLGSQTAPLEPVVAPPVAPSASPYVAAEALAPTPPAVPAAYSAGTAGAGAGDYAGEAGPPPAGTPAAAEGEKQSSGLRRALVIGGATAAALLVLGLCVLAAIFAFGLLGSKPPASTAGGSTGSTQAAAAGAATGTASSQSPSATTSPGLTAADSVAIVTNADVYAVRDPFEPLLKPLPVATTTSSSTSSSSTSSSSSSKSSSESSSSSSSKEDSSTLTLVSISTKDGVRVANLTLGGTDYALAAGQQVGDTPWQVLSVESDYVVMLYGDERITLTPGQGMSK